MSDEEAEPAIRYLDPEDPWSDPFFQGGLEVDGDDLGGYEPATLEEREELDRIGSSNA